MRLIRYKYGLSSLIATGFVLPLIFLVIRMRYGFDWFHENTPLLKATQSIGAFFALSAGMILYIAGVTARSTEAREFQRRYIPWVTCSLITSGTFTVLSAAFRVVDGPFLLLELLAQFFGALFSLGVWLPYQWSRRQWALWYLPLFSFLFSIAVGLVVLILNPYIPSLLVGTKYGPTYIAVNQITACLFLLSSVRFMMQFKKYERSSDLVFAQLTLLSATSDFVLENLHLWGPVWWTWHAVQNLAYTVTFVYLFILYYRQEKALEDSEARYHALSHQLQNLAGDLERSNRDLENFANLASHDLREPLRTVTSFLLLLERKYGAMLNDEAREYLNFAVEGSKRMDVLVKGLLTYAKACHEPLREERVNCSEIVNDALKDLQAFVEETRTAVAVGPLPIVKGSPVQLRRVFENLIQNAIKYRGLETPRIRIRALEEGDCWKFEIEDNGKGIPPNFLGKVFELFSRGPTGEQDGTGIGLAACKAIIERHGGRIGVTSEPGHGSVFYFNLPKLRAIA